MSKKHNPIIIKTNFIYWIIITLIFSILIPYISAVNYCDETKPLEWIVGSPVVSPSEVNYGETVSITIPITNNAQNTDYDCYISIDTESTYQNIQPQNTKELIIQINAPSDEVSSQKTETIDIDVRCSGVWERTLACDYYVYSQTNKLANYKYPTQENIEEQKEEDKAYFAGNIVINMADEIILAINSSEDKINEASEMGVSSVSSAQQYLNLAESDFSNAISLFESGQDASNYKDYSSAISYFEQSKSKLESAQSNALKAKNEAERLIDEYKQKVMEAQVKFKEEAEAAEEEARKREEEKECTENEIRYYDCSNDMKIKWCECINEKLICVSSPETQCQEECNDGCLHNEVCYPIGSKTEIDEKVYCSVTKVFENQKNAWAKCNDNYGCKSNLCLEGECTDVNGMVEEASKFKEIVGKIMCRLSSLFRIEKYDMCLLDKFGMNVYEED